MDTLKRLHEKISALADGELADSELELALAALASADGHAAWQVYHLIGDTLRAQPVEGGLGEAYAQRLVARLAAEPLLSASPKNVVTAAVAGAATTVAATVSTAGGNPAPAGSSTEPGGALPDTAVTMP